VVSIVPLKSALKLGPPNHSLQLVETDVLADYAVQSYSRRKH
jgi:hypothetical protein